MGMNIFMNALDEIDNDTFLSEVMIFEKKNLKKLKKYHNL